MNDLDTIQSALLNELIVLNKNISKLNRHSEAIETALTKDVVNAIRYVGDEIYNKSF